MVLLTRGDTIDARDLPEQIKNADDAKAEITLDLEQSVADIEKKVIQAVLTRITQNRTTAARILGISLRALHYKIKRYGIGLE
jgi:transcriptional regulator with PAS, ATPase and Fis domain